jgi:hypothetical protein
MEVDLMKYAFHFGRIPVPSCVSIAIPPGLQTIAFHNPSSFKEEKCL